MSGAQLLQSYVSGNAPELDDLQAETLYAAGFSFYENTDFVKAADVFRLLALVRPHAARSWVALAATHEAVEDHERAMVLYGMAAQSRDASDHERAEAYIHLARVEHLLGEEDAAEQDLQRAIQTVELEELEGHPRNQAEALITALRGKATS